MKAISGSAFGCSSSAAFALEKGAYAKEPVKSQFGYHVILVEDKRTQAPPPLEQVEPQVRQLIMRDKYVALLEAAKGAATVEIEDPALKTAYDQINNPQQVSPDQPAAPGQPAAPEQPAQQ